MRKTVAELMSVDFVTVTARMSLPDSLRLLVESDSTELCVVDESGRLEGIITDFDLLKASLNGELDARCVGSSISRAVTVLPAHASIDQAVPFFREGSCSRVYVCRDGRLLGRLSRSHVLKHLAQKESDTAPPKVVRPLPVASNTGHTATAESREKTPRAPQFLATPATSVLGGISVERSRITSRPSA